MNIAIDHPMPCPHCGGKLQPGGYLVDPTALTIVTRCSVCCQTVGVPQVSSGVPWAYEPTEQEREFMRQYAAERAATQTEGNGS